MPGFTTHYILGMKAFNDMPGNQLKYTIAKYRWLYQLGLQGPDIFFYNIPIIRHRDYRNVGSYMHEHHIRDFFSCYLDSLGEIPSKQQRAEGLAYFCGYLCHYIGDSICHPYVYGRIGYDAKAPTLAILAFTTANMAQTADLTITIKGIKGNLMIGLGGLQNPKSMKGDMARITNKTTTVQIKEVAKRAC